MSEVANLACRTCSSPYVEKNGECVTYCPPGNIFDTTTGQCQPVETVTPELKQCRSNPIAINSGEKIQQEAPDISIDSAFPLMFQRTYRSQSAPEARGAVTAAVIADLTSAEKAKWTRYTQPADYFGPAAAWTPLEPATDFANNVPVAGQKQWSNNFSYFLAANNDGSASVLFPDGSRMGFTREGQSTYPSPSSLTKVRDGMGAVTSYHYLDASNTRYVFAPAGQLIQVISPSGLSQWLDYDVAGNLASVRDDFGHQLTLAYTGNLLQTLAGNGEKIKYAYDAHGNLTGVTRTLASGSTTARQYHYEDTRYPYALTGITDERGVRYATWRYDAQGRAIESSHAGTDKTTFAFTADTTTVTNPLGKQDVYIYATVGGARRLVSVAGQASTSCLAANQSYTYYDNGLTKTKTDWQGNVTAYAYNDRGLVTQLTEALGKPEQRIVLTEWHPTLPLPTKVTEGNQTVIYEYDAQGHLLRRVTN
ncbi:DUF6531 domain-containing protein [Pseudomonas sp. 1D4]|uniref:DUF6531 domain-containing protein n=1 Tax=Pseudomonas sp. 1D4 TaxID=1843691 RepID=UPI00147D3A0F|nr:DUF6531 domain-containing protein [Pseudomonas sp. 1D4]